MKIENFILFLIGLIFIVSGVSKSLNSYEFINKLISYKLGYLSYIAPLISNLEIYLGLTFIFKINVRLSLLISVFIIVVFSIIYVYGNYYLGIFDCGCFGDFIILTPFQTLLKNFLLTIAFVYLLVGNKLMLKSQFNLKTIKMYFLFAFCAVSFTVSGFTIDQPLSSILKYNSLIGTKINKTTLSHINDFKVEKEFVLFVFSPICDHCWNSTENIKKISESKVFGKVFGIISNSKKGFLKQYEQKFNTNFKTIIIEKKILLDTFGNGYPKLLVIKNGKIVRIYKNDEIPCLEILKTHFNIK